MTQGENRSDAAELAIDTTSSVVGAMVGLVVGGPIGAAVGGAAPPLIARAGRIASRALARRAARAERVATIALSGPEGNIESGIERLDSDPELADTFFQLLSTVIESDESLDAAFGRLLAEVVRGSSVERERAVMLADSLRGLRPIQLRILQAIDAADGELSASGIATAVAIPELELRAAVRNLEARGMIKDLEIHPVQWRLRELGKGVVTLAASREA